MSIQSEITRISGNVQDALDKIAATGVTAGEGSDALPAAAEALALTKQDKITVTGLLKGSGSAVGAAVAGTDYTTPDNVLDNVRGYIGRGNTVLAPNTDYTHYMARGASLNATETTPTVNGAIAWQYG